MTKTIFITGASTGLGKATAKLFQSKGWHVIATMRNPSKENELNILPNVTIVPLDVTDSDQITTTVANILANQNVDVVFNNAGYGLTGALEVLSDEKITTQITTNLLGAIRVTKAFIPYFREKKNGIFINTTSIGGICTFPLSSIYHATKWALEGWSESLSFELSVFNISVKTVAPGGIKTDFMDRSLDLNLSPFYEDIQSKVIHSLNEGIKTASSAEEIAQVVYEAATDGINKVRYVAGKDANYLYSRRNEIGNEESRKEISIAFLGQ